MNCPRNKTNQGEAFNKIKDFALNSSGQALIIILLVSVIGLTLGLSLASRATQETDITTELEESTRAFSAAEAGLEESIANLGSLAGTFGTLSSGDNYTVDVQVAGGTAEPFAFPGNIKHNQPVTLWLTDHDNTTGDILIGDTYDYGADIIDICWGLPAEVDAGLELTLYYRDSSLAFYIARSAYNRSRIDNASSASLASSGDCGGNYKYKETLDFTVMFSARPYISSDALVYMKIRPIVESDGQTRIAISPAAGVDLPSQGEIHYSVGETASGQKSKVVQFISHPAPPELFDNVIYSDKAISK